MISYSYVLSENTGTSRATRRNHICINKLVTRHRHNHVKKLYTPVKNLDTFIINRINRHIRALLYFPNPLSTMIWSDGKAQDAAGLRGHAGGVVDAVAEESEDVAGGIRGRDVLRNY